MKTLLSILKAAVGGFGLIIVLGLIQAVSGIEMTEDNLVDLSAKTITDVADGLTEYARLHPLRTYVSIFLAPTAAMAGWHSRKIWFAIRSWYEARKQRLGKAELLDRLGLDGWWPHKTKEHRAKNWSDLAERIAHPQNNTLWIMGATGLKTFAQKDSPLNEALHQFNGSVRILLLNPEADACRQRASSVQQKLNSYKAEIRQATKFCESLAAEGKSIELRYYDWPPTWKVILTTGSFWLQHYEQRRHVEEAPVITGYATQGGRDLYGGYYAYFDRMFKCSTHVPLGTKSEPLSA